jgi:pimeloyl-ACP methyl ester carboxylesterase
MTTPHLTPATRGGLTPARIVALLLIAAVAVGLVKLRSGRDPDRISVPPDARSGQLTLKPCTYASRRADCGTLVVPENRRNPRSRLIALPVTRIHARSAHPAEPIFRLEGGPGLTNMEFPYVDRVATNHDVVLVGYRGVDGSSRLDCPEVASAMKKQRDLLGDSYRRAVSSAFRACSSRLRANGTDLAGYTLPQRVDDLDDARKALHYRQVDLLSESAGTRTALIYSWRHPHSIHRSVMIGVNPPGHFVWDGATTDAQIRRYARLCAKASACRSRTRDLAATMRSQARALPDHWMFLPIHKGNARVGSFFGLMDSSANAAPLAAPSTIGSWLSAAKGDPSGLWLLSFMGNLVLPQSHVWGEFAAIGRADAGAARRYFAAGGDHGSILGNAGTRFLFAGGDLLRAWPANADDDAYSRIRDSNTETLLIGGTVDFATPAQNATRELLPHLRNGHQVVLGELGHTTDFWSYQPAASTRLITTFLDSGRVDDSLYHRRAMDFHAVGTQTIVAKAIVGTIIGLPLLAALALAGIVVRVRRRGRLGRRAGGAVRALLAPVLGLAGWLLAVGVALAAPTTIPVDDETLVMVSVALSVAAGVYWGWVDRSYSRRARVTGLAGAAAAALIGARVGFSAGKELLALVTAVAGAVAAANLALIALDVSAATRPRERVISRGRPTVPALVK